MGNVLYHKFAARWRNHCCRGKQYDIMYSECVIVALVIDHTKRMRRICHLWPVQFCHIFPHYMKGTIYKKEDFEHKMCVWIISTSLFSNTQYFEENSARSCHKCANFFPLSSSDFNEN